MGTNRPFPFYLKTQEESQMENFRFGSMIDKLKAAPKTIVFTEGTDPRILEAAQRLLKDGFLTPILV